MYKTVLKVEGMKCGMCESHINDLVRKTAEVKKVTSSHSKGETVIISENPVDGQAIAAAIAKEGYGAEFIDMQPYEKRGLFGRRK